MSVANPLNPGALQQGCWKRKDSGDEGEDSNSRVKRARCSYYFTLESESPQPTSSDEDESIYSIQAHETEYVRDTSDTSTNSWGTSDEDVTHVEYEPASLPVNENPFVDCLTSSDPEHIEYVRYAAIAAAIYDSDVGLADDSDDSITSRDSEISHADYWECIQCNNSNNNPLFRYCEKCYQERKLFLPPRPKRKKRRKPSKKRWVRGLQLEGKGSLVEQDSGLGSSLGSQTTISFDLNRIELDKPLISTASAQSLPGTNSLSQESVDTGFGSSFSQATTSSRSQPSSSCLSREEDSTRTLKNEDDSENVGDETSLKYGSQESQDSLATTVAVSETNFDLSDGSDGNDFVQKIRSFSEKNVLPNDTENKLCLMCTIVQKNAAFVHGRDAHICCCFRCAMKVWKTTKRCPICNRKVTDVLRAYF